jgi:hypothetical protein
LRAETKPRKRPRRSKDVIAERPGPREQPGDGNAGFNKPEHFLEASEAIWRDDSEFAGRIGSIRAAAISENLRARELT